MASTMARAGWARDPARSRGRRLGAQHDPEGAAAGPEQFRLDRDRIVHSTAFRRLVYKTQVFLNHEGDLFRTRLTHSIEVAQLARTLARSLRLDEDLVEALALAHDLGHTPFGHAGQEALNACMAGHGGFEHNLQSLRVVDVLEATHPGFDGLNLSFEAREGILKHCSRRQASLLLAQEPGGPARRFVEGGAPSLEAQLVDVVDSMAYRLHDIDDGVRSGLIGLDDVAGIPLVGAHWLALEGEGGEGRRRLHEALRRTRTALQQDLVDATLGRLQAGEAAAAAGRTVGHSPALLRQTEALSRWLFARLYRHPQVLASNRMAEEVVRTLFAHHHADAATMPPEFADRADRARAAADYVSGMTDRFAREQHLRLTGRDPFADLAGA